MSTWRTNYTPEPARRERRRARPLLLAVLAVVLGPLALALVLHLAVAIVGTSPAPDRSCAQPVLLRAADTL